MADGQVRYARRINENVVAVVPAMRHPNGALQHALHGVEGVVIPAALECQVDELELVSIFSLAFFALTQRRGLPLAASKILDAAFG